MAWQEGQRFVFCFSIAFLDFLFTKKAPDTSFLEKERGKNTKMRFSSNLILDLLATISLDPFIQISWNFQEVLMVVMATG